MVTVGDEGVDVAVGDEGVDEDVVAGVAFDGVVDNFDVQWNPVKLETDRRKLFARQW